jgi:hypothetical protein
LCTSANGAIAQTPTARIVSAANAFLATLDETQRKSVSFAFDDEQQRARWSNFPQGIFKRAGLNMGELNPTQRSAAMTLVSAALSKRGFEKVQQIVDADEVLKTTEGNGRLLFGKDLYYISILGTPSDKTPWMLQFGGHHLALNITIAGERGILTPSLTGVQPALYTANGKTVRPLGQESDKALALLNSLDSTQRSQAILNYRVADLVLGPGQDGKTIQPEGLKASAMTEQQRAMTRRCDRGMERHRARERGRGSHGGDQGWPWRHLVRVERAHDRHSGPQHHGVLQDPGTEPRHRVRAAADGW